MFKKLSSRRKMQTSLSRIRPRFTDSIFLDDNRYANRAFRSNNHSSLIKIIRDTPKLQSRACDITKAALGRRRRNNLTKRFGIWFLIVDLTYFVFFLPHLFDFITLLYLLVLLSYRNLTCIASRFLALAIYDGHSINKKTHSIYLSIYLSIYDGHLMNKETHFIYLSIYYLSIYKGHLMNKDTHSIYLFIYLSTMFIQ